MTKHIIHPISSFLTERKERIKPDQANDLSLLRVEKINFSGRIHLIEGKETKTDMIIIKKGDLIISGINVAKGALAVYDGDEDILATIHYSAYSFNPETIDIEFLKWFLKSPSFVDTLIEQTGGGIKTEIKAKKFLSLKIPLPTFDEQKKIESKLNNFEEYYMKTVHELQSQSKLISKLRSSILSDAVSGRLVPQYSTDEPACVLLERIKAEKERLIKEGKLKRDKPLPSITADEIPYELPEGWAWCRIDDICTVSGGIQKTPKRTPKEHFFPYLGVQNVQRGYLNLTEVKFFEITKEEFLRLKLIDQDLLIIEGNGSVNEIGRCAIWRDEIKNCIHQNHIIRARPLQAEVSFYILKMLNSPFGILQMQKKAITTTGLYNLSVGKIRPLLVPLPPLVEQHRIVAKVEQLMATCDALEAEVAKSSAETDRLMQTILKEAFD